MPTLHIKRGDTLALACALQTATGPVDMTGWQIDCWLRSPGGKRVQALAATSGDAAQGQYTLSAAPAETLAWPEQALSADVRYTDAGGRVMHTATFVVCVLEPVTTP